MSEHSFFPSNDRPLSRKSAHGFQMIFFSIIHALVVSTVKDTESSASL